MTPRQIVVFIYMLVLIATLAWTLRTGKATGVMLMFVESIAGMFVIEAFSYS